MAEKNIKKIYYSPREAATFLKVSVATLRVWITKFNVSCIRKSNGTIRFTENDLETLKYIHHLLYAERYTFEGVKIKLNKPKPNETLISNVAVKHELT